MRRRLSIGVQWALRYTLALLMTVSVFAIVTYSEVARRTERDAALVLALQVNEVAESLRQAEGDTEGVMESIERRIASAESDLKLGFALFDAQAGPLFARGSLERYPTAVPEELVSGEESEVTRQLEVGENYPYLVTTLSAGDGYVQGALYSRRFVRNARDVRDIYLYSTPVLLILTAGLGYALARGSLRPIREMNRTARRISGTHLDEKIPTTGSGDELDELAGTLNDMLVRIAGGVERMRRFSGNAAHELRTPLNALRSRLEVTLEQPRDAEEMRRALVETAQEVEGLAHLVNAMMRLAQSEAGLTREQKIPVDLGMLLGEVGDFFAPLAEEAGVDLRLEAGPTVVIPGDPAWLHELFANLLDNAIKYTRKGGRVELRLSSLDGNAWVEISDTGVGIEESDLPRVFEPFHRVGPHREAPGVGLGLPIAREIARAHAGELQVESRVGEGTTFTVRLPQAG